MVVCRVKSYAEEFVPITDEKGEVHQKNKKTGKGVPSHIQKNTLQMYEESLFKKKVFGNNYNAILHVKHNVNTYSMKQ